MCGQLPTAEVIVAAFGATEIVPVAGAWRVRHWLRVGAADEHGRSEVARPAPAGGPAVALARVAGMTQDQLLAADGAGAVEAAVAARLALSIEVVRGLEAGWDGRVLVAASPAAYAAWEQGRRARGRVPGVIDVRATP